MVLWTHGNFWPVCGLSHMFVPEYHYIVGKSANSNSGLAWSFVGNRHSFSSENVKYVFITTIFIYLHTWSYHKCFYQYENLGHAISALYCSNERYQITKDKKHHSFIMKWFLFLIIAQYTERGLIVWLFNGKLNNWLYIQMQGGKISSNKVNFCLYNNHMRFCIKKMEGCRVTVKQKISV